MKDDYIDILLENDWVFEKNNEPIDRVKANNYADNKLEKVNDNFFSFINKYMLLTNQSDNVWYIPIDEYSRDTIKEDEFSWNSFEIESLEYADDADEKKEIKDFWNKHLPFLFSVKDGYSYIAMIIEGKDKGKIVYGREPEYEDVEVISDSFDDFQKLHSKFLKEGKKDRVLSSFI